MIIFKFKSYFTLFFFVLLIGVLSLWPYFNTHYSIDCYRDLFQIDEQYYLSSVAGRPLTWFLIKSLVGIGLSPVYNQQIFFILSIVIFSIGITLIIQKLLSFKKLTNFLQKSLLIVLVSASFFNLFTTEVFQFNTFLIVQALAFLFVAISIFVFKEDLSKKKFLLIVALLVISLSFYQSWIPFFIIYSLIVTLIFFKNKKQAILNILFLYAFSLGINFVYILLIHPVLWPMYENANRLGGLNLISNFSSILRYLRDLFVYSLNLYPPLIFLLFTVLPIFFHKSFLKYLGIIFFSIVFGLLLHFFTKDIWLSQRSTMIIAAIPSLLFIFALLGSKALSKTRLLIFSIMVGVFSITQAISMNLIGLDLLKNNEMEFIEARSIILDIKEYEKTSGINVKRIYYSNDKSPKQSYKNIRQSLDVNVRALTRPWSFPGILKLAGGKDYFYTKMPITERDILFPNTSIKSKTSLVFIRDKSFVVID